MAQIIRQPDGSYAIWDVMVNDFAYLSMNEDEVIRHFASKAYEKSRQETLKIIEQLNSGGKPYFQGTLTWDEACARVETEIRSMQLRRGD